MEWIPIEKEGTPIDVGILITDGKIITCAVVRSVNNNKYIYPHEYSGYDCECDLDYKEITHWANLPMLPKK